MGVLPVSKKEGKQKEKNGIGPRMKNGRTNHIPDRAFIKVCRRKNFCFTFDIP